MDDRAVFTAMQAIAGVEVEPGNWARLGAALHAAGATEAALLAFQNAAMQRPQETAIWHALTAACLDLKLPQAAWQACERALALNAENVQTLFNSGVVREALQDAAGAVAFYTKTLACDPGHYGTLCNLPRQLWRQGKQSEALRAAQDAVAHYPHDAELHVNLGDLRLANGEPENAAACFSHALGMQPDLHAARYALSVALAMLGRIEKANHERNVALAAAPPLAVESSTPFTNGVRHGSHAPAPERIAVQTLFERIYNCDWDDYTGSVQLFTELVRGERGSPPLNDAEIPYLSLSLPVSEALRQQLARQAAARIMSDLSALPLFYPERPARHKLHIAYISADFCIHPVGILFGEILGRHDRERFVVHAYSLGAHADDSIRTRAMRQADVFRDIEGLSAHAAAQLIISDGIDILVDLSGYTRYTKPEILALRPAPIQVSYLGYVATMGAPWVDYAMLDRDTLTPEIRAGWDEKIAYLPGSSYHCEMPAPGLPCPSRQSLGLPENTLVLGALHHPRKLEPHTWTCWMKMLRELPQAVLWLLCPAQEQQDNLVRLAASHGVDRTQLVFAALVSPAEHLARLQQADVFLDTFVYNGHTTTIDALSAGVPVVTLSGQSVVSRIAGTMLKAHGLSELVAESEDEYRQIVLKLAGDRDWLQSLRERTRYYSNSNLFCPERKLGQIETAYEMMWARHRAGLPPEDFDAPAAD